MELFAGLHKLQRSCPLVGNWLPVVNAQLVSRPRQFSTIKFGAKMAIEQIGIVTALWHVGDFFATISIFKITCFDAITTEELAALTKLERLRRT